MIAKSASKLFNDSDCGGTQSPPIANKTAGRNLTYTIGNAGSTMNEKTVNNSKCDNGLSKELTNFSDNLVRPTPDEKKRSYFPKNLNVR